MKFQFPCQCSYCLSMFCQCFYCWQLSVLLCSSMSLLNWFNVVPGYFQEPYLPTRRGFDTFLGMYESGIDYYMHTRETEGFWGLDMHWDMGSNYSEPIWDLYGDYATDLFTQHARIVNQFARIQMFKVHFEPAVK